MIHINLDILGYFGYYPDSDNINNLIYDINYHINRNIHYIPHIFKTNQ
jgi:hypothetical protein